MHRNLTSLSYQNRIIEGIVLIGRKVFYSGVKSFGPDGNPATGKVYQKFSVVYTAEEKVDCRKDIPITAFLHVIVETQPDYTRVG